MSQQPTPRTDTAQRILDTLLAQFDGRPVIREFLNSHAVQLQALELVFWQLEVWRTIDNATGAQLDGLGSIVGEQRLGRSDDEYRAAVRSRIRLNRSFATVEEVLGLMRSVAQLDYTLTELGYATIELELPGAFTAAAAQVLNSALQRVRAAGVRADTLYHGFAEENVLTLASGDGDEFDSGMGVADDAETTGGYFADIL